jgi:hypothetical protein
VTGKAIGATHDAQPAVRMQPDMENLGGVAGLAAALAVQSGCPPRQLDVGDLQRKLVEAGALPERVLHRSLRPRPSGEPVFQALLDRLDPAQPLHAYQDMELDVVFPGDIPLVELCCAGPQVAPFLENALRTAAGAARLMIARALALVGSPAGVPDLIEAIHAQTPDEGLQRRRAHIRHANLPPDQGAAPEVVYLLYTLGMARDRRALPVWEHFADLAAEAGEEDLRDRTLGLFYYVDAICFGAERLGDPQAVRLLRRMHGSPLFHQRANRGGPGRFETDYFLERQAHLELVIARALARCGDGLGLAILVDYLDDNRALLARHARSELARITGQDFGLDPAAWRAWIAQTKARLRPVPLAGPTEPQRAWEEEILTGSGSLL